VPPGADADGLKELLDPPPNSDRAPASTWRPKQKYPSYVPPEEKAPETKPGRAFAIKVLDSAAELVSAYRLRYQVFESLGYLQQQNRSRLEIDVYDRYAIPFGAIAIQTGELVGTLRLITNCVQAFYAGRIHRILDAVGDPGLRAHVLRARKRPLPSIVSQTVQDKIDEFNVEAQEVEEMSREIVHPKYRGVGVARGLMEFGIAYAQAGDDPLVIAGCLPEHVAINGKYGYVKLPGTDVDLYDSVGQIANTIACNTRRLPEPARTRVGMILEAMRMGEPECILEECPREAGGKGRSIWHFTENYYVQGAGLEAVHHGGARVAVR
jgi:predicted GNAT family N-acyltransferase